MGGAARLYRKSTPVPLFMVLGSSTEVRSSGSVNNWRPSATGDFSDGEEESADDTIVGMRNGIDISEQVVLGGGALRGEQEAYSMRDLQSMKVPRLRSMCEARGLKKIGTKPQLINRLLNSTPDAPNTAANSINISPNRLVAQVSPATAHSSSGSSPVPAHAAAARGDELEDDLLSDDEFFSRDEESGTPVPAMRRGPSPSVQPAGMRRGYQTEPDYRPQGEELARIMNAPKMVRRAGRTYMMQSSKVVKYQKDQLKEGTKFVSSEVPMDMKISKKQAQAGARAAKAAAPPPAKAAAKAAGGSIENARAATLNDIPREFLPPSLRSFDPASQNKRRGPGRPRVDDDSEDSTAGSEWDMVKAGGGMYNQPSKSPFDDMIAEDIENERLEAQERKARRRGAPVEVSASVRRLLGNRAANLNEVKERRARRALLEDLEEGADAEGAGAGVGAVEEEDVEEEPAAAYLDRRKNVATPDEDEEDADEDVDDELPDIDESDGDYEAVLPGFEDVDEDADEDEDENDGADFKAALFKDEDDDIFSAASDEDEPSPAPQKRRRGRPSKAKA